MLTVDPAFFQVDGMKQFAGEKGSSPVQATYIPWVEIFRNHVSIIQGHLKMVEMVQKHTVKGTENYMTISGIVDRTRQMLQATNEVSGPFVEPPRQGGRAQFGASSTSVSRVEHFGNSRHISENTRLSNGAESGRIELRAAKQGISVNIRDSTPVDGSNPHFFIDTNPTPVHSAEIKRKWDSAEGGRSQKRRSNDKFEPPIVETEDISAEVMEKLKSKGKKGGKRRRDSEGSETPAKRRKGNSPRDTPQKRSNDGEIGGNGSAKKRRRRKK